MSENTDQKNVIDTNVGLVRGAREKVNIHGQIVDVHTYKGSCWCSYVPFAVPPVGKLRFKNPVPANQTNGWEWIYDASSVSKKFPHWSSEIIGSEDCLYLNVFTPTLNNNSNLSVFVWVYGRYLQYGSGNWHDYYPDSEFVSSMNVARVSMNYRLKLFGFLKLKEF